MALIQAADELDSVTGAHPSFSQLAEIFGTTTSGAYAIYRARAQIRAEATHRQFVFPRDPLGQRAASAPSMPSSPPPRAVEAPPQLPYSLSPETIMSVLQNISG